MTEQAGITVTVDQSGTARTFDTPKEFQVWLEAEVGKWRWLEEVRSQVPNSKGVVVTQLHPIANEISQLQGVSGNPEQYLRQAMNTAVEVSNRVKSRKFISSEDPAGRFVISLLGQKKNRLAAFALSHLIKASPVPSEAVDEQFEGHFLAAAFANGLLDAEPSERAALAALAGEYRSAIEADKLNSKTVAMQHEKLRTDHETELSVAKKRYEEQEEQRNKASTEALTGYEERFGQLQKAFNTHMALKAPVDYWTKSTFWHRMTAGVFGTLALVWGYLVGREVYTTSKELLEAAQKTPNAEPPYWEIGLILFVVTLAIWLLRVLVRIVLSNLHQAADAKARATMTEAYLALIEGGKAIPDDDRILVLSTLFRPMTTGLIKDDGMPPTVTELLSRIVGGKGTS